MQRQTLGQMASLGSLYDARTDKTLPCSFTSGSPPEAAVMRHDNPDTQMVFIQNDRFCDKFAKLNVSAKLSASFLAGMVAVEGSGAYLDRERTSSSVIEQSLRHRLQTKHQRFYRVTYSYIYSSISPRP